MLEGVALIWMPVQDIERAEGFYQAALGLPIGYEEGDWAVVDANGLTIGLDGRGPQGAAVEGGPVLVFQPEGGLEETVGALQDRGVEVPDEISDHGWGRIAAFKDSEGNNAQLHEPPSS